jgi:putative glutamine amidotransferase
MNVLYSAIYGGSCAPFDALVDNVEVVNKPHELTDTSSVLIIWGGADINPDLYGHPTHSTTYPGGARDRVEWALLKQAVSLGIPIIGVCRGAQMLCAAAGGFLIQDVEGHHGNHLVHTHDGKSFKVNSIHHQMMAGLEKVDHELLAWADESVNEGKYYGYKDDLLYQASKDFKEPEFVYFPSIRGFAIQWHPEMMKNNSEATMYILNYIQEHVNGSYV